VCHNDTGIVRDQAVNTFHFDTPLPSSQPTDFSIAARRALDFYVEAPAGFTAPIANFMSSALSGLFTANVYDLADGQPRPLRHTEDATWAIPETTAMPNEVAVAVSYKATPVPGIPASRLRGRIFIGPLQLGSSTGGAVVAGEVRPSAGCYETFARAGRVLMDKSADATGIIWVIRSAGRYTVGGVPQPLQPPTTHRITSGYVDNAFDTIRSRGHRANFRRQFTA
jgi:hypothetical protein